VTPKKPTSKSPAKAAEAPAPTATQKATEKASVRKTGGKKVSKKVSKKGGAAKRASPAKETATRHQNSSHTEPVNRDVQQEQSTREPYTSNSGGKYALAAGMLALVLSVYAVYEATLSSRINSVQIAGMEDRLNALASGQQGLRQGVDSQKIRSEENTSRIDKQLGEMESSVATLELAALTSIDDIKANLGESVARWKLDEVHSLLTRVSRTYQLTGEQSQAISGLELAKSSLATIDNPRLAAVSTALAEDILRVKADRIVDVVSINDRLVSIISLIPDLVLVEDIHAVESELQPGNEDSAETEGAGILAAGKTLFGDIGSLVKHKDLDAPLQPSLDEYSRFVVYESLRLQVHAAMVASLRRDNASYQSQLALANGTLNQYFDAEQVITQTIRDQLQVLQSYDLSLNVQAILGALDALNRVMVMEN
jgi:uncharacterized protein HemX